MRAVCVTAALLLASAGCGDPEVDDFRSAGGSAPDPTGVIRGTVLYVGPRPECEHADEGPVRPIGRVVLTLFEHDDPPPPTGSATSAENLLTIPGSQLFSDLSDCVPEGEDPGDARIVRSTSFVWPEIELHADEPRSFQIRGFYDHDEDFNPFFSATNQPTRGDVAGGAFVDVDSVPPEYLSVDFPSERDAPDGAVNDTPIVTLGAVVSTTRPVFELGETTTPLDSEAPLPNDPDPLAREAALFELTQARLSMFPRTLEDDQQAAFDAAGLDFDLEDERAYAWYVREVDVDGDGEGDPHPILGRTAGVRWYSPVVIMKRVRSEAEARAGVPDVLLVPSVRPSDVLSGRTTHYRSIDVVVAPVAAVVLDPEIPACRIPYVPPGNDAVSYEDVPVECHELPTGLYSVNAFHGFANARFAMSPASPTMWQIDPASEPSFTGQAWTIPNELGDPCQLGDECSGPAIASQSPAGMFVVHDPHPDSVGGGGSPECETSRDAETIDPMPVPAECCAPVARLCGLPLCPSAPLPEGYGLDAAGRMVRQGVDADGDGELDCVPFLVPASCCE